MYVLHMQAMLGIASLDMVQHYAKMVDNDLPQAQSVHSPIDNLSRLAQEEIPIVSIYYDALQIARYRL
jgi:hypothetical protein